MVSKGQFVGLDWNRIARLHSQVMTLKSHLGLGFFSESSFLLTFDNIFVSSLTYSLWRLVGCILICINVTAGCC